MNPLAVLSSTCPLLLASIGALFSEYAGVLALFLEGLINLSAFLTYTFTIFTGNPVLGLLISTVLCTLLSGLLAFLVEKFKAHSFIAGIGLNLFFSALVTFLSFYIFGTRGVLANPVFNFDLFSVRLITIIVTCFLVCGGALFLGKSRKGIYFRITGTDSDVLLAKGVNPSIYRIASWAIAAFYASMAGGFLAFRISSFVPNIASGRGWMALAAVFIGKKKPWKIILSIFIFCLADIFSIVIQNFVVIPSSLLLSFPYLVVCILILIEKK